MLFVLGGPYKGSSPIEFFNTLLKLPTSIDLSYNSKISQCWTLLDELKIKCQSNPEIHHLLEKIKSIKNSLECYLIDSLDQTKYIHYYILLLKNELDLSVTDNHLNLLNTFILNNASAENFRFFFGKNFNKTKVSDISNLIAYSPDRKDLLEFFIPSMTKKGIICLFEKAMNTNDHQMICDVFDSIHESNYYFNPAEFDQIIFRLLDFCAENRNLDLLEKYLIIPYDAVHFVNNEQLFNLVKLSFESRGVIILNKLINFVPKETFFGLGNKTWLKIICDLILNSENLALEALAQSYFDSDIKTMLLNIKEAEELEDIDTVSAAIENSCLDHSTRILDILLQSGCTIDEILFLASPSDNLSFIAQLDSNSFFNDYSITTQEMKNKIFKKRDETVMWLMDKGCPLSYFQEAIDIANNGDSFIYRCAKKLEFDLLSKMLQKTENYNDFMRLPSQRTEHLLFVAAKAASKAKGELKVVLLNFILTALDHPSRTETLNQAHYSRGLTPLHYALSRGDIDLLTILLEDQYLTLEAIGAKTIGLYAGHTAMRLAQVAIRHGVRADLQTCIEMLENKKQQLIMQNLNAENSRRHSVMDIENQH